MYGRWLCLPTTVMMCLMYERTVACDYYSKYLHLLQEEDLTFCKSQSAAVSKWCTSERQSFIDSRELPEVTSPESQIVNDLRLQLEECRHKLGQAATTNKQLYEYSVKLVAASGLTPANKPVKGCTV